MTRFLILISTLIVLSCRGKEQWTHDDFFNHTFSIIEDKSIKKDSLDWGSLERTVRDSIRQFKTAEDAYQALAYTIELINDGHSVFLDPKTSNRLSEDSSELFYDTFVPVPPVPAKIIEGDIGYLKLTGYVANRQRSKLYSTKIRKALYTLDSLSNLSGWILDLRENMGGLHSMMPLGVAPIFQDSLVGILVDNRGKYLTQYCTNRYFYFGNLKNDSIKVDLNLKNERKPVAVLISGKTVSAGETLAAAFRFQPSAKLFGAPTRGKTTGLELIDFNSGAKLLLATLYLCNKDKEIIHQELHPDVECTADESYRLAIEWIKGSKTNAKDEHANQTVQ
jgi:hypothetical protein